METILATDFKFDTKIPYIPKNKHDQFWIPDGATFTFKMADKSLFILIYAKLEYLLVVLNIAFDMRHSLDTPGQCLIFFCLLHTNEQVLKCSTQPHRNLYLFSISIHQKANQCIFIAIDVCPSVCLSVMKVFRW